MYTVICCNRYYVVGQAYTPAEALQIAQAHVDGTYDCIIVQDGRHVGDKSGFYPARRGGEDMGYRAGYNYACGYHD